MQRGAVCGAVIGAVCAIGSATGRTEPGEDRKPSADAVKKFLKGFEKEFGSVYCRDLQKTHVESRGYKLKSPGMYRICTAFVVKAVEMTEEILR